MLFIILALLIAVAMVLFVLQNSTIVTVSFLSFHYSGSLALILVVMFTLGLLVGILISLPALLRKNSDLRAQKRRVRQLEESITASTSSHLEGQEKSDKY
jgi:putative membrane protein